MNINKNNIENIYQLTLLQEGLLFHYLKSSDSNIYFVQLLLELSGAINLELFQKAWQTVVDNNEMLRTVFRWDKLKTPVQVVLKEAKVNFQYIDLMEEIDSVKDYEWNVIQKEDYEKGFDLTEVPFRLILCKFNNDCYKLLISNHHIIYDGWSNGIILEEFLCFYDDLLNNKQPKLNNKVSFKYFIKNNRESLTKDKDFWTNYLYRFDVYNNVFLTKNTKLLNNDRNDSYRCIIGNDKVKLLKEICELYNFTIANILYSAWGILLNNYSGKNDIIFGTTVSGRDTALKEVEKIVGLFINTIPLRLQFSSDKTLLDTIIESSQQIKKRIGYENTPLQKILEYSGYKDSDLFESIFIVENYPLNEEVLKNNENVKFRSFSIKESTNYKLTISAYLHDQIELSFNFSNSDIDKRIIENISNHYVRIIDCIINDKNAPFYSLDLFSSSEKHQLLYEFNNTASPYPKDKTIHGLFEDQAAKAPDRIALVYGQEQISYSELNSRANSLALHLINNIESNERFIGIHIDRSIELYIGILGIIKSGRGYIPLDASMPEKRLEYILKESNINTLLVQKYISSYKLENVVNIESVILNAKRTANLSVKVSPTSALYVIYTSGSTGFPKGVITTHKNVVNLITGQITEFSIQSYERVFQFSTVSFDASVEQIWLALLTGATLVSCDKLILQDTYQLEKLLNKQNVTHFHAVPSYLKSLNFENIKYLKRVISGGDICPPELIDKINSCLFYNEYGPTETTVTSVELTVNKKSSKLSIGKPLPNYKVYILGSHNELLPIGVAGELCISGAGLSQGYLNNPELTRDKFIEDPFHKGGKLYKTGDLARWLPDGNIEFLGRIDHQVKIRGYRIELGEIESTLLKHKKVKDVVVVSREDNTGDKYLCAYVVLESPHKDFDQELRSYLLSLLPDYMVPAYIEELLTLPLTSNGKIDRKTLPLPALKTGSGYKVATTVTESQLLVIWSGILGLDSKEISITANFFELGGHSLKATLLVSRIHKELGVRLELREVFEHPTIQGQGKRIEESSTASYSRIEKAASKPYYSLSPSQRRLYLLQQLDLDSTAYNMPGVLEVPQGYGLSHIQSVFEQLIHRHDNFRTSFGLQDELPVQIIHPQVCFNIDEYHISEADLGSIKKDFVRPFDLSQAPLLRLGYLHVTDGRDKLMIDMHHILSDARSHTILTEEFQALLSGIELAPLRLQYKDYSEWQNSQEEQDRVHAQAAYWVSRFSGEVPVLKLPTDYPRPAQQGYKGSGVLFSLTPMEAQVLQDVCREEGLTPYMFFLSVYAILLSKLSGETDIVIGSPIAGRRHADLDQVVGLFINTLALRINVFGGQSFIEYVKALKQEILASYEHQEYPFEELVDQVVDDRDLSRNPLFDVMFNMLDHHEDDGFPPGQQLGVHQSMVSKFDLTLTALDQGGSYLLSLEYNTDLFKPDTIDRYLIYFKELLRSISEGRLQQIKELNILSSSEKHQLLYEFNNTASPYPKDKTIHGLFEDQVAKAPDRIALVYGQEQISYSELNSRANSLALHLINNIESNERFIGIHIDRSIELYIGILGIIKSGRGYIPLDASMPEKRLEYILKESNINTLLVQKYISSYKLENVVNIESVILNAKRTANLSVKVSPTSALYVIYTSGSTGFPKGVITTHKNVVNLITGQITEFSIQSYERVFQFSTVSFDASVEQIWLALLTGATLVSCDKLILQDTYQLEKLLNKQNVTHFHAVPSYLKSLNFENIKYLKRVISGGDICPPELIDKINSCLFYNEYGPTETTVTSVELTVNKKSSKLSIGKPLPNYKVYILGSHNELLPIGVAGELCISGAGLSQGYLNNPELTRDKFIEDPFHKGGKLYKTGDLARWLPDGNIEFLGRIDHQVKIRGYRIELGEIESTLLKHKKVKDVVVVSREDNTGDKYLCAYVVLESPHKDFDQELRSYLLSLLPDYMVPAYIEELLTLPLTSNGKIDRKTLPLPALKTGSGYKVATTVTESQLLVIWSGILGLDSKEISITANFFELGGHSLKATLLVSRIHKELGVRLELREVFEHPTIQGQGKRIEESSTASYSRIEKAASKPYYSLSPSQRRLYLLQQLDLDSTAYNMPGVLEVPQGYGLSHIQSVFEQLIHRHDNFRTSFGLQDELPVQIIHPQVCFNIDEYHISEADLGSIKKDFVRPFDLSQAPLLRLGYLHVTDGRDKLMIDMHHILSDARSHTILTEEFQALLSGIELAPLRLQYKDYSEWQNSQEEQDRVHAQAAYWVSRFSGEVPVLKLPTDYPRPAQQGYKGSGVLFSLTPMEAQVLQDVCREEGLTPYMFFLSVYAILLSKLSGETDIVIGSPIAGRRHADLDQVVGLFINTLALRINVFGGQSFIEYVKALKQEILASYEHQEYPFEELVDQVVDDRDLSRNPLFDVMFNMLDHHEDDGFPPGQQLGVHQSMVSKFDLTLTALDQGGSYLLSLEYNTDLFKPDTIDRYLIYFKELLRSISEGRLQQIKELNILSSSEKHQLLYEFNNTASPYPKDKTIHGLFEDQAAKAPDRIALVYGQEQISYSELNSRANQIGHFLLGKGVKVNEVIGLLVERSIEMLTTILGILKSGGAYLPINHNLPQKQINYIVEDSDVRLIFSNVKIYQHNIAQCEILELNGSALYDGQKLNNIQHTNKNNLAYVIYTSGSTGKPKGVIVGQKNVVNLLYGLNHSLYEENIEYLRFSLNSPIFFDASVKQIFPSLTFGHVLVIVPDSIRIDASKLVNYYLKHNTNIIDGTPSHAQLLFQYNRDIKSKLRIKQLVLGGDILKPELINGMFSSLNISVMKIINVYGPTECTDVSTLMIYTEGNILVAGNTSIGKPLPNYKVYILGSHNELLPIGVAGELCISGAGLSQGYLNNPELTRDKFIEDPFHKGGKLYKTGDLARWLPDGNIEFLGRIDHQVKIRGYRIELGEIESTLLKHKKVKDVVVVSREDNTGDKYLCAYVVLESPHKDFDQELRSYLLSLLPDYMVPAYIEELLTLPLTSNGKIDRKTLPLPALKTGSGYKVATTVTESQLLVIWSGILGLDSKEISITANFFELGGHSLKATLLVSRIHKELGVRLELREVFEHPTIQGQGKRIEESSTASYSRIEKAASKPYYSLSPSQRRLYLLQQLDLDSTAYNMPGVLEVPQGYGLSHIQSVFEQLIHRHDNFRTSFGLQDELPVQIIHPQVCFNIDEYHISEADLGSIKKDFVRPFDLSQAPLLRLGYLHVTDGRDKLMIDMHHILSDARSHTILTEEFQALLSGIELAPLRLQYKDYSEWQNSQEEQDRVHAQAAYWVSRFSGEVPVLKLPTDYPRPAQQGYKGSGVLFSLTPMEAQVLQDVCREEGLTPYMFFLSVYAILLSKLSGETDIVIGSPIAGRRHADLDQVVGLFINTLALRINVFGGQSFIEYVKALKQEILASYEHQEYPFEELVDQVVDDRDLSRNPLFDVMFNMLDHHEDDGFPPGQQLGVHQSMVSKFDLTLTALDQGGSYLLSLEYNTDLFKPDTIDRYLIYFKELLRSISEGRLQQIKELNILSSSEKHQLLYEFNNTASPYPKDKTIHGLFEDQAAKAPDRIALVYGQEQISYSELNSRANQIGHFLLGKGVKVNEVIGLLVERSIEMLTTILGILKSGGAYLPINHNLPQKQINYIVEDSDVRLIFSNVKIYQHNIAQCEILELNGSALYDGQKLNNIQHTNKNNLAYVIYTSGSTGKPKGVIVGQKNVVNLLYGLNHSLYEENIEYLRFSLNSPIFFDASVKQIFPSLTFGHVLVIVPDSIRIDASKLVNYYLKHNTNIIDGTPSHAQLLFQYNRDIKSKLRIKQLVLGGDILKPELINGMFSSLNISVMKIINVYGPTECTDVSTLMIYTEGNILVAGNTSIGKPLPNYKVYILGSHNELLPIGVAGELCISGAGLSQGYLNNPELTRDKFIEDPFHKGGKLYKTGDLARWLPDGNIEFLGRIDHQVKIRGYRIELGEIESTLLKHKKVKDVVVVSREDNTGDKYLCAYVVLESPHKDFDQELRSYLLSLLPDYMVPAYIEELLTLPLTSNGKIDRKTLPLPALKTGSGYKVATTVTESQLLVIWSGILGLDSKEISITANFFELGGHSLKATLLVSRIHKELGVRLELREVFEHPTIQGQGKRIEESSTASYSRIEKAASKPYYSLSPSQRRLYLLQQLDLDSTAYNMPGVLEVPQGYGLSHIQSVFEQLIHRHDNFRTSFGLQDELPVQIIHPQVCFNIDEYHISEADLGSIKKDFVRPFDLSQAPLLRLGYLHVTDGRDKLMIDMHHILSDARSHTILTEEFQALLSGIELAPLRLQYKDYSEWQNSQEEQDRVHAQAAYWVSRFSGEVPVLKLPTDYPRPAQQGYKGSGVLFSLTPMEAQVLQDVCREEGLTPYMFFLSVYAILLSKLSGETDIVIGSPIAGRRHADLDQVVGLFINTLALRINVFGGQSFIEYVKALKQEILASYEHQEYPFEELVDQVVDDRDLSRNPLFDVMFNMLDHHEDDGFPPGQQLGVHQSMVSKFDLTLTALDQGGSYLLSLEYNTDLFKPDTIDRYLIYFKELLRSISEGRLQQIKELNILSSSEKHQLLYEFNNTASPYPKDKTIHGLFEDQAAKAPDRIALVYNDNSMTYRYLNECMNSLAYVLKNNGVTADCIVGLYGDRSPEMIISQIAVLKAGGAYLPIDSSTTLNRCEIILKDSRTELLLIQSFLNTEPEFAGKIIKVGDKKYYSSNKTNLENKTKESDLVYVIYTSGSTGKPKGVMVEHKNFSNAHFAWRDSYELTKDYNILQIANFGFDVFSGDIARSLLNGGKLIICPTNVKIDFEKLSKIVISEKVNALESTPGLIIPFLEYTHNIRKPLKDLKLIIIGSDILNNQDYLRLLSIFGKEKRIINSYGVTEATIDTCYYEGNANILQEGNTPIGKPLSNMGICILNSDNQLLPIGVAGELCISGAGLSQGYLNNPELTRDKFIEDPFHKGGKLYKTGDLARWLPDGNIEFLGRIDHQVKIRGYRIELGEIESTLLKHKKVKDVVVVSREDNTGDKYLCAYVVLESPHKDFDQELRSYLLSLLPDYMVPAYIEELLTLPLTSNGKIDRKTLPLPALKTGSGYKVATTVTESQLLVIWSGILGLDSKEISITANFFELGGHSLKATLLVSRIHKELGVRLELREVFEHPTIQGQGKRIEESSTASYSRIEKAASKPYYSLSPSQRRLYLLQQLDLDSTAYNMPGVLEVPQGYGLSHIQSVFEQLIHRHDNFRTSFGLQDELPVQIIHPQVCFNIDEYHISEADLGSIKKDFVRPFDLSQAPLLRLGYLHVTDGRDKLMIDMHHILSDARSHTILTEEFQALLSGIELAPLRLQYKDYSEWQNSQEEQDRVHAQAAYWVSRFSGEVPVLKLPTDYPRPAQQGYKGSGVLFSLTPMEAQVLQDVCREEGLTPYMFFLSVYAILLSKLSGETDIVIGSPIAGRRHADLDQVVGLFINTLALRINVFGGQSFIEYVKALKQEILASYEHQEYPFEELVDQVVDDRDLSRNPLFDVMFNMLDHHEDDGFPPGQQLGVHQSMVSKFDLTLTALDQGGSYLLSLEYNTDLFKPDTIDRYLIYFKELLRSISEGRLQQIKELNILSSSEKHQLLYEFNNTASPYPKDKTIHGLFEDQAAKAPDRIALVYGQEQISYSELNSRANQIANYLVKKGIRNGHLIGLSVDRSIEMIKGIIGILKVGGAYVPISREYPKERINDLISDSEISLLLKSENIKSDYSFSGDTIIIEGNEVAHSCKSFTGRKFNSNNLAYIMYTSGSTGKPKGVEIEHKSVIRLVKNANYIDCDSRHRILQTGSPMFDATTFEIYCALLNGGSLHLARNEVIIDATLLGDCIVKNSITTIWLTSSLFNVLADQNPKIFQSLIYLLVGGDVLSVKHIQTVKKHNNKLVIINGYGPTENTTFSTTFNIDKEYKENIPIGHPISNSSAYILNRNNKLQPIGIYGELLVGGDGVARGYLNNPELTRDKFIEDPFHKGGKLYKTGDLARWLPDGNIEFLGRIDHQVKIRGYRIELGEIESTLLKHKKVKDVVVVSREDNTGDKYLCAYVVLEAPHKDFDQEFRSYLLSLLPDYMVPAYIIELALFPLTENGKIDKKALPKPKIKVEDVFIGPRNTLEKQLQEIWADILNIEKKSITINSNFFNLGGHSLKATILANRIHKALKLNVSLSDIFKFPTIQELSSHINAFELFVYESISKAKEKTNYCLSSAQKRLYFLQQFDLKSTAYNISGTIKLSKEAYKEKVEKVLRKLIKRHESFRTSFHILEEQPVQIIHNEVLFELQELRVNKDDIDQIQKEFVQPFDLSQPLLFRALLLQDEFKDSYLLVDMHHIISDGTSLLILENDFKQLYEDKQLEPLSLQYKDYSEWQNSEEVKEKVEYQKQYWLNKFSGDLPKHILPIGNVENGINNSKGKQIGFILNNDETYIVRALAKELNTTPFIILMVIVKLLFHKTTGRDDLIIGTVNTGRENEELNKIVGMFVNTFAIRSQPSEEKEIGVYISEVENEIVNAFNNQLYQFDDLIDAIATKRLIGGNPLFNILFAYHNQLKLVDVIYDSKVYDVPNAKFDLMINATEFKDNIRLNIEYSCSKFSDIIISDYIDYLKAIIIQLPLNVNNKIAEINLFSEIQSSSAIKEEIEEFEQNSFNF